MSKSDTIERVHKTNIKRLVEEFGKEREGEINQLYTSQRLSDEREAKILDFIPIFTCRTVKDVLSGKC